MIKAAERKAQHAGSWLAGVMGRQNKNVATVALANKNARIVWALLAYDRDYATDYGWLAPASATHAMGLAGPPLGGCPAGALIIVSATWGGGGLECKSEARSA